MKSRFYLILLILFISIFHGKAQISSGLKFEDINQSGIPVTCLFQDEQGQVWVCSQEGMYIYDGVRLRRNDSWASPDLANRSIRCVYKIDREQYYIGCESGLYLFNLKSNSFTLIPETSGIDVRVITPIDNTTLLFGTMNGVIRFNTETLQVEKVDEIHSYPVIAILTDREKQCLYISNNKGFFEYNLSTKKYTFISLPIHHEKSSLIHAINYDSKHHCLWLGAEKRLFRYDIARKEFQEKQLFSNNTINTISIDSSGNIWVGTDSGICTYNDETGNEKYLMHSSRSNKYVIWAIFEDKNKNIWVGTDSGLSLYKNNPFVQIHRWEDMSDQNEGNRMTCIFKDSRGNYWFGGTNGLGRLAPGKKQLDWYKVSDKLFFISHDRIRSIYEDSDRDLWVGTNESINRFDYNENRFIHYTIMDSAQIRSADWCQSVFGDTEGHLWISSFLGGVFRVDKKNLIAQEGRIYLAEKNYYQNSGRFGLSSNRVQTTILDKLGNIWVTTNGHGLNKIDFQADSVVVFAHGQSERNLSSNAISSLFCDTDGYIWVGLTGGLDRIDPQTHKIVSVQNDLLKSKEVLSITEKDDFLWFTVSDGLFALNKKNHGLLYMKMEDMRYMCSLLDKESGKILIGGINHYISFVPERVLDEIRQGQPVILTTLYVNNEPICTGMEYDGNEILKQSLPFTEQIILNHNQNNLTIQLTDSRYNQIIKAEYMYMLENLDKSWAPLDITNNQITYTNLHPGKYNLIIRQTDDSGRAIAIRELSIQISSPWYSTLLAKLIYIMLIGWFSIWTINYFRVKNNLKIERLEKEKALEISSLKMEFLTNMSHELKTPLSLIISPLNKLLITTKNTQNRKLVETIHQNATRLSSLVNQITDSSNMTISKDDILLSKLEIVEFARSIFDMHKETFNEKGIQMEFKTDTSQLYIYVDILKLESILNNLLSNAYKFTEKEDTISLIIQHSNDKETPTLKLIVSDTGVGIPAKDIPFLFSRFYQSEANAHKNKDGSGIGLSMVKRYVELHNGEVHITSEVGKGTDITVSLPIINEEITENSVLVHDDNSLLPTSEIKVLIVEDNVEIARFLTDNLKDMICTVTHNGKSGYEMAQELEPDIIISDVMMPVMDGIEMSRLLKQNISTATIPIILITAKDDKRTESQAYKLGIDAFISKPFDMKELEERMQQIIRSKSLLIRKIKQSDMMQQHKEIVVESIEEKLLIRITEIIEERLADSDLNVQKLSEISGYNSKQIYRRIKQLTGHTVVDYIKSIRLKKAALLLEHRKYTVSEVMYQVGFSNPSYFSKCFAEKYGKTPKQYMESTTNTI